MSKSQNKQGEQITNREIIPKEGQNLRKDRLTISNKSKINHTNKRPLRRLVNWWKRTGIEKFLEDIVFLLKNAALLNIINLLANVTIIISLGTWWISRQERWEDEIFSTWQIVNDASEDQSGVTRLALERLLRNGFSLSGLDLNKTNLKKANLEKADLEEANLQEAVLIEANLREAAIKFANLEKADLEEANLQQANLIGANLQEAVLEGTNLQQAVLEGTNLQQANLMEANLQQTNLVETNLQQANLVGANLRKAILKFADLQQANLVETNLQQANLVGANLREVDLMGANLQQVNLGATKNITPEQIKSACNWKTAIYKGEWNEKKKIWQVTKPHNENFIKELEKDKSSDPQKKPDCRQWEK